MKDCPQLKLENQLCFPLYAVSKEIVRRYGPVLEPLGLTYTQYIVMLVMWDKKRCSLAELGDMLYLDSGTLTPVVKKLENKGYVQRLRDTEDERRLWVLLTEEGEKLKAAAAGVPAQMAGCVGLPKEDALKLAEVLRRLLKNL